MYTDRVGFISYVSGERFAHAGPSEAENQWTVPCNAIYAQDIVGRSLLKLKPSCAGNGFEFARERERSYLPKRDLRLVRPRVMS